MKNSRKGTETNAGAAGSCAPYVYGYWLLSPLTADTPGSQFL